MKLSFRLDAIASLRDVRQQPDPSPAAAALTAANCGVDAVTAHLRSDRKGIREDDLDLLQKGIGIPLYFDIAPAREAVRAGLLYTSAAVTLVPDRWEESWTESGIDVVLTGGVLESTVKEFRSHGVDVLVFIDPDLAQVKAAHRLNFSGVRLSTRPYALAPTRDAIEALALAAQTARRVRLAVHAGGNLDYRNVAEIARIEEIDVIHAGSAIVSRAIFTGLDRALRDFRNLLRR